MQAARVELARPFRANRVWTGRVAVAPSLRGVGGESRTRTVQHLKLIPLPLGYADLEPAFVVHTVPFAPSNATVPPISASKAAGLRVTIRTQKPKIGDTVIVRVAVFVVQR